MASGRPLRNVAKAKFPPILPKGVLFGGRPDRGVSVPCPASRVWRVMWWLTVGVRPATTQLRTGEAPAYSPEGCFIRQATRQRGRLCEGMRSGTQTIDSTPDLCKSGAEGTKTGMFSTASAQHNKHTGLNGVTPYSTGGSMLTENQHLRG